MRTANRFYFTIMMLFLVLVLGYLSYEIFRPFFSPISWAVVLAVLFYPVHAFILRRTRRRSLASLATLVIILIALIAPATYLFFLLIQEVAVLSALLEAGKPDVLTDLLNHPFVQKVLIRTASLLNMSEEELIGTIAAYLAGMGRGILAGLVKGIGSLVWGLIGFILMAITLFFTLRDSTAVLSALRAYLPFSDEQKDRLMKQTSDMIISTIYGGVVVAAAQGAAGGAVFALLGIATPVVWGVLIAFVSFLPAIGPGVVWLPAAIYFLVNGEIGRGAAIIAAGIGIAAIDTFLRPAIIGNRTKMPFLLIFFSVIGGVRFFGLIGFILGPLVLALFLSVLDFFGSMNGSPS